MIIAIMEMSANVKFIGSKTG